MKIDMLKIDDNSYYIVNELNFNNYIYLFLINNQDKNDVIIRKKIIENNEEYIIGLENEEEFEQVRKEAFERISKWMKNFFQ